MALVLVKEDGTGLASANSYASAADGDAFHLGHYYASAWTSATTGNKETALVMATRLIDSSYQFNGFKKGSVQALQWPREAAIDPDRKDIVLSALENKLGPYFESDKVPKLLSDATCELARELLVADRTAAPTGEGLKSMNLVGTLAFSFDKADRLPVISHVAQSMLSKLGNLVVANSGTARLVRT
jgi:hypothetical protein